MKYALPVLALIVMLYVGTRSFIDFFHSGKQDFIALAWGLSFSLMGILGLYACYKDYQQK
jgi:hypothetical protein